MSRADAVQSAKRTLRSIRKTGVTAENYAAVVSAVRTLADNVRDQLLDEVNRLSDGQAVLEATLALIGSASCSLRVACGSEIEPERVRAAALLSVDRSLGCSGDRCAEQRCHTGAH